MERRLIIAATADPMAEPAVFLQPLSDPLPDEVQKPPIWTAYLAVNIPSISLYPLMSGTQL